ncbi:MAG TPA: multicopper oxidase domain-containing protein [bacterium]|nr:multicopper oxidase domain-containing protein [bacterium]
MTKFGRTGSTVVVILITAALVFGGGVWFGRQQTQAAFQSPAQVAQTRPTSAQTGHEEMDAAHEARVKAFPAKTQGLGAQPFTPKIVGGVKVFEITASAVEWEVEPGVRRAAFAYNGQVPGPTIRVTEGDRVRVVLKNSLPESTSIHFHGLTTPNAMDGVPYITQPPVRPGQTFTYEFEAKPAGTHMYHSHHGVDQITKGLLGAFIVVPKRGEPNVSADVVMVINDGPLGYTLNGKGFPATQPIVVQRGQRIRVRYLNEGQIIHPMHLHGFAQQVIAKDGRRLQQPYFADTVNVAPGERYDVLVTASIPGVWALHCHILSHAESARGMHGMVTAVIVK